MTSSETPEERSSQTEGEAAHAPPASRARLLWIASVVVVVLLVARVVSSGAGALERGDAAHARGDHLGAAGAWREAISWVLPGFAPWRGEAMDRLDALAQQREAAGDLPGAVQALSSLRSGILAGHGLWRPDEDRVAEVDGRLAPLLARWEVEDAAAHGRTVQGTSEERVAHFAAQLQREVRPNRGMSLLALLGFFAWLGGVYRSTRLDGRDRLRAFAVAAIGLVAMLLGVALA